METKKEITTIAIYKEDKEYLDRLMNRGETFRIRFHKIIKQIKIPENEI